MAGEEAEEAGEIGAIGFHRERRGAALLAEPLRKACRASSPVMPWCSGPAPRPPRGRGRRGRGRLPGPSRACGSRATEREHRRRAVQTGTRTRASCAPAARLPRAAAPVRRGRPATRRPARAHHRVTVPPAGARAAVGSRSQVTGRSQAAGQLVGHVLDGVGRASGRGPPADAMVSRAVARPAVTAASNSARAPVCGPGGARPSASPPCGRRRLAMDPARRGERAVECRVVGEPGRVLAQERRHVFGGGARFGNVMRH